MAFPKTEGGYNLFDMLSMMQKAIRRGLYNEAGFAAYELKKTYRAAMWNRLLVISAEDCYGVVTKEIIRLKQENTDSAISRAVALLCKVRKSRDACYFSCNFILAKRKPREITPDRTTVQALGNYINGSNKTKPVYDMSGFEQMSLFEGNKEESETDDVAGVLEDASILIKAITHIDMDMIGYQIDKMRFDSRNDLWTTYLCCADEIISSELHNEIKALQEADESVNKGKKTKDEIFISKAAILLVYQADHEIDEIRGDDIIPMSDVIDWRKYKIKPLEECRLKEKTLPEWVFDCHTLKGKKAGKTDWDMTRTEQDALHPLQKTYFDEASWIYIYEQDYETGVETEEHMIPIREYAKSHEANPVAFYPYEN